MSVQKIILLYVMAAMAALCALAMYTEFRRRRFNPGPTSDRIFRCEKCGYVYTDDPELDRSRCSQCGQVNDAIEF